MLEPEGETGLEAREPARRAESATRHRPLAYATGKAGDVYLCHPFLVHAGQPHRGTSPRFLGQPKLTPTRPLQLARKDGTYSPVEIATADRWTWLVIAAYAQLRLARPLATDLRRP
ncbi:hypothetical protein Sliba_79300 [Streptomyces nigrescens]|uniref:Phytanoyl-CoA dioxygenase n=1 Tax=Streptomyces nigrescens TaxID=1920 RepID=A0A640TUZ8_STRNI|nr:hypothetical protein Sliba_79300 [Streptomyces libani subsp. libani]GGV96037.1 hypothetical protein GCM10010500_37770 [Streptomyces libani subsp. libani]